MAGSGTKSGLPARWLAAAIVATLAMLAWISWHGASAVRALERMQVSHAEAAVLHDTLVRLESELQTTIQLGIAAGDPALLEYHAGAERELRRTIESLLAERWREGERSALADALSHVDAMSREEDAAVALWRQGNREQALARVTGPGYEAHVASLAGALKRFDDSYHDWGLEQSVGLTRGEIRSLAGAFVLFAAVIGAWLVLILRLRRERASLLREIQRRSEAEAHLLHAQKNEVLGQLAGSIAHDVDNVLSAVAGYAGLAGRARDEGSRRLALDGLGKAVAQGRGLTRNLLSFTRHETSGRRPVDLREVVRDAQGWIAPLLPASIRLHVAGGDSPLWVDADPVLLQQAFANVALNARDAMPGGGTLTVTLCRRGPDALPERAGPRDGVACLSLADTGGGMDAATLAHAFDPLFTTKPAGQGTGLGLPAVQRIIESHGGAVHIESSPGRGTRVRLLLPASDRSPAEPAGDTGAGRTRPRCTLVSADAYTRQVLGAALEDAGIDVEPLDDAAELWGLSGRATPPDAVVIDWPGEPRDALGTLRRLREAGAGPPVLICEPPGAELEADLADLATVVARPVALAELGAFVRRLATRGVPECPS